MATNGDIQVIENRSLNSYDFHLYFSTKYQTDTCNSADSSLVISGSSKNGR